MSLKVERQQQNSKDKRLIRGVIILQTTVRSVSKCQGFGHIAANCPNQILVSFIDEASNADYDEEEDKRVTSDGITIMDNGEMLVVHQALKVVIVEEDDWIHHNIFHKNLLCHYWLWQFENVGSTTMVDKLKLHSKEHPNPYNLVCLWNDSGVTVTRQCLVKFSFGKKYNEKVWCNVILMDNCHMLLGWLG